MLQFPNFNAERFLSQETTKNKVQLLTFGCVIVLIILLGLKLFSIESNNAALELIFNETKQKIELLSSEITTMDKQINSEQSQDEEIKMQLFAKLNKRVKSLENMLKEAEKRKNNEEGKARSDMTIAERIEAMENTIWQQSVILDLLENNAKEVVRQTKIAKFNQIAEGEYFKPEKRRNPWLLERNNIKTPFIDTMQEQKIAEELKIEADRLESTYHMSKYTTELPFCIIVPSFNNAKNFRYEFNLQSIFNQEYSNYRVVIVDDNSSDNTTALIKHFLKRSPPHLAQKVVLITNKKQMTAVPNIHMAITKHCKPEEIGFFVDGDDELVGNKVFKVFNAVYQSKKPAVAYSIALEYWVYDNFVKDGWSKPYSDEEKIKNQYRDVPQKISHLRSFRVDLYLDVKERDLKDINGEWFTSTYDQVICLPMLEMSCGNIEYIDDYFYLYVYGTGFNDRLVDSTLQWSIANYVKTKMPKYTCNPKYAKSP